MNSDIIRALIFLSGACLVVQGGLVGTMECTYGPAFWCGSLRNAKQCSAVNHCIQTVWEKQQLPEDNDSVCGICKDMVQQARDTLESNQTQKQLKQVFEGSCRLIPLKEIVKECITLVDEFIPELIETLASQMNPQIVCATAGLCNSVRIDRLLRDHGLLDTEHEVETPKIEEAKPEVAVAVADPDPGDCQDCKKFVGDTVTLVREHSKQELLDHLLAICGELGSVSDGCSALMANNIDVIHDFLANQLNVDDTCNLFGMCGDLFGPVAHPPSANTGDEACDFCIVIAQHWRDVLTSNTTEEQFREILDGICGQTGQFKSECVSLVDNYYSSVYNWLMNSFNPKQVCEAVGICKDISKKPVWSFLSATPAPALARVPLRPSISIIDRASLHFVGQDEANSFKHDQQEGAILPRAKLTPSIRISVAGESGVLDGGNQACTMCQLTLHFIQNQLQDKKTKDQIENAVKTVCSKLPTDLREQCDDYVDAYGDQVIALLQQEIDPSILCPMLGLCPSITSTVTAPRPAAPVAKPGVSCVACEFIMIKVKELLANKTNEVAIRDALDRVCSVLPHSLSTECQTFVDQNAIEVMQLLAAGVSPEQICRLLGLCSNVQGSLSPLTAADQLPVSRLFVPSLAAPSTGALSLENHGQSKVCVLCEFALAMIEKLILDNNTHIEDKIEASVKQVCIVLPSTLQEDCLGFVEQYGRALVELLVNGLEPSMVCRELHLCKPSSFANLPHAIVKRSTTPDDTRCLVCKAVANTHSEASKDGADASVVQTAVADFCGALAGNEQQLCQQLDVSALAAALQQEQQTSKACVTLNYCTPPKQHMLGSERCTWGPSYWCQSLLHAQSCGATPHCQERVWTSVAPAA